MVVVSSPDESSRTESRPRTESNARIVRRLLRLSWRYRRRAGIVLFLQLVLIGLTLGSLGFTGLAVDILVHTLVSDAPAPRWPLGIAPPAGWSGIGLLFAIGGSVFAMALLRGVTSYAYSVHTARLVHMEVVPHLRTELYDRLQRLSFRFFDSHASGSIINRVTRDVQMLRSFVDGVAVQGMVLLLTLGFFLAYMLSRHVWLTLASLALTPLLYVVTAIFLRWAQPAYREERRLADRVVRTMAETIEGIQIVKVFGREADQRAGFARRNQALRDQQLGIFRNVSRFTPTIDLLGQLNIVVLLLYGGSLVARDAITLGDLVVFAGLLQQFASRVSEMAGIINTLQQSITGAKRVFDVLDARPEVESPPDCAPFEDSRRGDSRRGDAEGRVRFDGVHFGYDDRIVLEDISFEVPAGRCVGIVGATGSGKSSLLNLIPRFYDPRSGSVSINGVDVRRFDLDSMRRRIGIVFQESFLFRDTVANNIAFGHPEATREQIERAAKLAGAHEFVGNLRNGYDTVLEEGAFDLSGGQRQRLAIARALLLDPPILLLDDPTAAIDPTTAAQILRTIDGVISGRTVFIVSNRLGVLRCTDEIIVLDRGRIVERGTHRDLLQKEALYSRTALLQGVATTRQAELDTLEDEP